MAGDLERAETNRGWGAFPAEWGAPVGDQFSEERARWVAARVQEHGSLQRLRRKAASMRGEKTGSMAGAQARVELLAKRW